MSFASPLMDLLVNGQRRLLQVIRIKGTLTDHAYLAFCVEQAKFLQLGSTYKTDRKNLLKIYQLRYRSGRTQPFLSGCGFLLECYLSSWKWFDPFYGQKNQYFLVKMSAEGSLSVPAHMARSVSLLGVAIAWCGQLFPVDQKDSQRKKRKKGGLDDFWFEEMREAFVWENILCWSNQE